jgi:hypothetical protein
MLLEFEGRHSVLNSFLEPGSATRDKVKARRLVSVGTVDSYCRERGIEQIEILKTDTEGFDLEVLRGAERLLQKRAVELIFIEISLTDMNKGQASLDEIYRFVTDRGFAVVSFYTLAYDSDRARYTNALFIQPQYAGKTS